MTPPSNHSESDHARLRDLLIETKTLVDQSQDSGWTTWSLEKISADLGRAILQITNKENLDTKHLGMLFGPTGPIQETALASDWHDDYIRLASECDRLI